MYTCTQDNFVRYFSLDSTNLSYTMIDICSRTLVWGILKSCVNWLGVWVRTNLNLGFKPTQTWVWIYCIWIKNDVGYKVTGYLEYCCTTTYWIFKFFFLPKVVTVKFGWVIYMFLFIINTTLFIYLRENQQIIIQSAHWSISFQTKLTTSLR